MAKRKNFVVVEYKVKKKGKSELIKFERKVNDYLKKNYHLVNVTTSLDTVTPIDVSDEPLPIFHAFLIYKGDPIKTWKLSEHERWLIRKGY